MLPVLLFSLLSTLLTLTQGLPQARNARVTKNQMTTSQLRARLQERGSRTRTARDLVPSPSYCRGANALYDTDTKLCACPLNYSVTSGTSGTSLACSCLGIEKPAGTCKCSGNAVFDGKTCAACSSTQFVQNGACTACPSGYAANTSGTACDVCNTTSGFSKSGSQCVCDGIVSGTGNAAVCKPCDGIVSGSGSTATCTPCNGLVSGSGTAKICTPCGTGSTRSDTTIDYKYDPVSKTCKCGTNYLTNTATGTCYKKIFLDCPTNPAAMPYRFISLTPRTDGISNCTYADKFERPFNCYYFQNDGTVFNGISDTKCTGSVPVNAPPISTTGYQCYASCAPYKQFLYSPYSSSTQFSILSTTTRLGDATISCSYSGGSYNRAFACYQNTFNGYNGTPQGGNNDMCPGGIAPRSATCI